MAEWEYCRLLTWAEWQRADPEVPDSPWVEPPTWHFELDWGESDREKVESRSSISTLNELGGQGWELIGTLTTEHVAWMKHLATQAKVINSVTYLFKRQRGA